MTKEQGKRSGSSGFDLHFAKFLTGLENRDNKPLFLAAALTAAALGEGHVCIDLREFGGSPLPTEYSGLSIEKCPDLEQWIKALSESEVVGKPGDKRPLILDKTRLYLCRYWDYEHNLGIDILERVMLDTDYDDTEISRILNRLFPSGTEEVNWQRIAAASAALKRLVVISGGPGTGKTTTVVKIIALLVELNNNKKLRIALTAPTGKAAAKLGAAVSSPANNTVLSPELLSSITIETSTIHRLLGVIPDSPYFRHNAKRPLHYDIVVVDEASMVDLALMAKLFDAVPKQSRLILLGDKDQLSSVEAGAVLGDICDTGKSHGFTPAFNERLRRIVPELPLSTKEEPPPADSIITLQKSYRFSENSGIGNLSRAIRTGDTQDLFRILNAGDDCVWKPLPEARSIGRALRSYVHEYFAPMRKAADPVSALALLDRFRILCAVNSGPYGIKSINEMAASILCSEEESSKQFFSGRPLMISGNDYRLNLFNGDTGLILNDPASNQLKAFFRGTDEIRQLLPRRLPAHETAYAVTIHKSQGSEFEHVLMIIPPGSNPVVSRELVYTGITRASKKVEIWCAQSSLESAVRNSTTRTSGLREMLWNQATH